MSSPRARTRWIKLPWPRPWLLPLLLVIGGLVGGLASPAQAATSAPAATDDGCLKEPECSNHYQKAISLYESGRYEAALPEFQAAYASRQMPWLLINIGRTFHRLGRLDEAITLYNRYEQAVPNGDPETIKKVREYKAQAEVLLAAKGAATPSTAEVTPPLVLPIAKGTAPQPLYKKWWFWTAIGGGVAVIAITGIAIGVATKSSPASYPPGTPVYQPMF